MTRAGSDPKLPTIDFGKMSNGKAGVDWYVVNEIFTSVQGEGVLTGMPATFIRLQGCTVGCHWCDSGPLADGPFGKRSTNGETRNTWFRGGTRMSLDEIMDEIHAPHVIITGGEPTLWNLDMLIRVAWMRQADVQLETSGQNALKGTNVPDWITWSPKANLRYEAPDSIRYTCNEIKYVVDSDLELAQVFAEFELQGKMRSLGDMPVFVLMPEGSPPKPENITKVLQWLEAVPYSWSNYFRFGHRLQYRLGVR